MDIDRYLRNTLDDADYAEASAALDIPYQRIAALEAELAKVKADKEYAIRMFDAKESACLKALEERDAAVAALCMIYDKYEDGAGCHEGFDGEGSYIGNAVMLSKEEEDLILALIPKQRDAAIDAARKEGV